MFFDDLGGKQNKSGKSAVAWDIIGGKRKTKAARTIRDQIETDA